MGRLQGDLKERTLTFAREILNVIRELPNDSRGWVVAKQFGRPGTSIGANVWEADHALTDAEFAYKINITRKESGETEYWLALAERANLLSVAVCQPLSQEANELTRILATMVAKTQDHMRSGTRSRE